jgi:hypothetical protein
VNWREFVKSRNIGARLAVLASGMSALAGLSLTLGAAPAAASTNPSASTCGICEPAFTIEKRQEIAGSGRGFTTSKLIGAAGQTVDYQIIVTNTGHDPVTFSSFTDPHCDENTLAGGPGTTPVPPQQSTTYTCSHRLAAGVYTNEATVTGSALVGMPVTHTSNQVVVEVPQIAAPSAPAPASAFTIEKQQEIAGSKSGFTTSPLGGAIGETVDYEIVVKNTGNVALKFSNFTDAQCDQPTIAGGPGEGGVAPGSPTTYTCSHLLASAGRYVNQATVTGTAPGVSPLTETSNPVEVTVPTQGVAPCKASQAPFRGPTGPKRRPFTVQVSSQGIQQITFYLDGRKLKTLNQSQARGGKFTIKIDPRKLSHGAHTLAIRGIKSEEPNCGAIAAASSFVRPFAAARKVKFTG